MAKSSYHSPDKNPGVKNIQERFARLGVIAGILRSPESRERYNVCFPLIPYLQAQIYLLEALRANLQTDMR